MGKSRKIPTDVVKREAADAAVRVNRNEIKILGLVSHEIESNSKASKMHPYVALKYFNSECQCFSEWQSEELKAFSSFLDKLSERTWEQIYATASTKGGKNGLGYTKYNVSEVRGSKIKAALQAVSEKISADINFFELRVDQEMRVHGFQSQSVFFLVALDRSHEAFPG